MYTRLQDDYLYSVKPKVKARLTLLVSTGHSIDPQVEETIGSVGQDIMHSTSLGPRNGNNVSARNV